MLILIFSKSITLAIASPVILANALWRRFIAPWYLFCVGMLPFIGSQVVHLPLNTLLRDPGILPRSEGTSAGRLWQTALVLGLSAGLCEESARVIGYAHLKHKRTLKDGLMMGRGHGVFESDLAATLGDRRGSDHLAHPRRVMAYPSDAAYIG